jgi:hypothetical protein
MPVSSRALVELVLLGPTSDRRRLQDSPVRRARKGDCLILHYGSADDPGLALIDGGPANVYKPFLKPRLAEIRKMRARS